MLVASQTAQYSHNSSEYKNGSNKE